MAVVGEHHPAFEEYCECIFELDEDDVDVIQARIADRLQVSRPAVSEMMRRLDTEGLITTDDGIHLTPTGIELAERVVRRHRLAERFLTDVLELSWAEAHHEAGKWEHVMSEHVETAMDRLLGSPTTCPHGNPIPGSDYVEEACRPLADVEVGDGFTVRRITEELEFTPGCSTSSRRARCSPGDRACSPQLRPTARSRSRSKAATSASGRSPAPASSSTRDISGGRGSARRRHRVDRLRRLRRDHGRHVRHRPPSIDVATTVLAPTGTTTEQLEQLVAESAGLCDLIVENEGQRPAFAASRPCGRGP